MDKEHAQPRLLIVDDERTILLSLGHLLKGAPIEVITCNRLDFAITAVDNHFFTLILADLRLSGLSSREGIELLSHVKKNSPATKFIIMTAFGSDELREEVFAKGADAYFEKPINIDELIDKMQTLGLPIGKRSGRKKN